MRLYNWRVVDSLSKIFGGTSRLKLIRLFVLNGAGAFDAEDLMSRLKLSKRDVKREIDFLLGAKFIVRKRLIKSVSKKKRGKVFTMHVNTRGYSLNNELAFLPGLKNLLSDTKLFQNGALIKKLSRAGKIKLIVLSGIFLQDPDARIDILIVGDHLNKSHIDKVIHNIEADLGKELRYSVFDTPDFTYRVHMYDRLVRDIFDYPHERIIDRIFDR